MLRSGNTYADRRIIKIMTPIELGNYLVNNIPGARFVSGGKEVLVRCPRCGDSSNPRNAHFYIGLGDENTPPMYHCKKCDEGGIFTFEKLRWFNVFDSNFGLVLNEHVKSLNYKNGNKINMFTGVYSITNNRITQDSLSFSKLKYVNDRLGLNLSFEEASSKKIVLNLSDILIENNINQYTRSPDVMKHLDSSFIGFLSYDNGFLNMRNLNPNDNDKYLGKRYINYNIFNKVDNSKRYYILPTDVNLLYPITVHIAEGPFDILSIYYNLRKEDNSIYCSIGGKSYLNCIKFLLEILGLINISIHIYIDSDIDDTTMVKLKRYLEPFQIPIFIHRNRYVISKSMYHDPIYEKDYGVPKERIVDTILRI
jgi:hypothetical protein